MREQRDPSNATENIKLKLLDYTYTQSVETNIKQKQ